MNKLKTSPKGSIGEGRTKSKALAFFQDLKMLLEFRRAVVRGVAGKPALAFVGLCCAALLRGITSGRR
jgi:hypothetical protein